MLLSSRFSKTVRLGAFMLLTACALKPVSAQLQTLKTRHTRDVTKTGLAKLVGHLPAEKTIKLGITLPIRDQTGLSVFLSDVYDPKSPNYRHFLSVDEFTERFAPSPETYQQLMQFALDKGLKINAVSKNRMHLDVEGSTAIVEKAFNITLNQYQHPTEKRVFYAPDHEPTVNLPFAVWHISGLDDYSIPRPVTPTHNASMTFDHAVPNASYGSGPGSSFLGSDMRAAYYGSTQLTGSGQLVGLFEFKGGFNQTDLNNYFSNTNTPKFYNVYAASTDGTSTTCVYSSGCDDTEQIIDITQAIGMAPGLGGVQMFVGSTDTSIFNAMATNTDNGLIYNLSVSWLWSPADPSADDPYFQEFAAQGQNVFVAAGDNGSWPNSKQYYYPAEDAYVTTVGGTDLQTTNAAGSWSYESAWIDGGGGVSPDHIAIPSWQQAIAGTCASCSRSYRNAPDVSANANFTFYVCANQTTCTSNYEGGTSFAAPMWAGYLALANQQSVANTGAVLGFINPKLYSTAQGSSYSSNFHDITAGNNGSFNALGGYDLATGIGSPNGTALISTLLSGSTVATKTALPYVSQPTWSYTTPVHHSIAYTLTLEDETPGATISYVFYDSSGNSLNGGTTTSGGKATSSTVGVGSSVGVRFSATASGHPSSGSSGIYNYSQSNSTQK